MKRYLVGLEAEERGQLEQLVRVGKAAGYLIRHANIVLAVDESEAGPKLKDAQGRRGVGRGVRSIESLRKRFVEEGLDAALERKKRVRPSVERMFDGEKRGTNTPNLYWKDADPTWGAAFRRMARSAIRYFDPTRGECVH